MKSRYVIDIDTALCKYLVWRAANGLGNRMISVAASFLYAVLTEESSLLNSTEKWLVCSVIRILIHLSYCQRNFSQVIRRRDLQKYESMLKNDKGMPSSPPLIIELDLELGGNGHGTFFHCNHGQDLLSKVPVVVLRSDQYFVPSLYMVPSFGKELSKMFPEKDSVSLYLGHYLFHPSNQACRMITKFYKSHLAKADQKIGLQTRVFDVNTTPYETVLGEILACTLSNNLLPELKKPNIISNI
ncbi:fucosyltransferase 2-like [Prosopis cineraria]|uniref:fucosyltransferase 2-like n=1 Tax=Prosopis cineraria TaxID=364024 RepID=UPI00240FCC48|nr:fucosyltransferase 2-like [Prosopis cineraria]XP_054782190.1 fucosyltransferase 2-like [Prosopis cineraria]XP_054791418.1 fucosyltransferase 2-like [Prosopis cineraria]XP_054791419.1 fucosyltransferase 2-like [Prosopis cineraria]